MVQITVQYRTYKIENYFIDFEIVSAQKAEKLIQTDRYLESNL